MRTGECEQSYYERRAAEQRRRAGAARHPQAAAAHLRLAELLAAEAAPPRPVLRLWHDAAARGA